MGRLISHTPGFQTAFTADGDVRRLLALAKEAEAPRVRAIIERAGKLKGLPPEDVAVLLNVHEPTLLSELFAAARSVKDAIYGRRLVLFAPLYYSSFCVNNCTYCAFRHSNDQPRRRLTMQDVAREVRLLEEQGHKRLLVIGGEEPGPAGVAHLLDVIDTVYATRSGRGEIRRVNVEAAPMTIEDFGRLKSARIGTYILFQETYDPDLYRRVHPSGPKADYSWRLTAMDRAMQAGLDDVGIGALFGLGDYRFEVLSLLVHARQLEQTFGAGPHTISVPRIEAAPGAPDAMTPPQPVSDVDFKKIVAILRLAVPYTGIILSTRERAALRTELLDLGVSQMSAGSCTAPGGYGDAPQAAGQFAVSDTRTLDEVIYDIASHGYIPSFCTSCYRMGRTGKDFMDLAKPGLIRDHCLPNALFTFREYLDDYGTERTRAVGDALIREQLSTEVSEKARVRVGRVLKQVSGGERDIHF
jgi:2-iminoacetate synthase